MIRPALPAESLRNPTEACLQLHALYARAAGVVAHTHGVCTVRLSHTHTLTHTCAHTWVLTFLAREQKKCLCPLTDNESRSIKLHAACTPTYIHSYCLKKRNIPPFNFTMHSVGLTHTHTHICAHTHLCTHTRTHTHLSPLTDT